MQGMFYGASQGKKRDILPLLSKLGEKREKAGFMKKRIILFAVLLLILPASAACSTHASKSATFNVETGDKIKVTVDVKAGYDLTMEVPFAISKGDELVLNGTFGLPEAYETYHQLAEADPNATILAEDSKDGNAYFFYTVTNPETQTTEYDYFVQVAGSQTVVIIGSTAEQEAVEAAFAATTIGLAEDD